MDNDGKGDGTISEKDGQQDGRLFDVIGLPWTGFDLIGLDLLGLDCDGSWLGFGLDL